MTRNSTPVFLAALWLAYAGAAHGGATITKGDFSVEAGQLGTVKNAANVRFSYGPFNIIELGEFYVSRKNFAPVFPSSGDVALWQVEKSDDTLIFRTKADSAVSVEAVSTLTTNKLAMSLSFKVPPGTDAAGIMWDLYLPQEVFSGAAVTVDGRDCGTLDMNACPEDTDQSIIEPVGVMTATTGLGTWRFSVKSDDATRWILRICRKDWRKLKTFSLLYGSSGNLSKGVERHLSVDVEFTPAANATLEDVALARQVAFLKKTLTQYGVAVSDADMPARSADRPKWLMDKIVAASAGLNESGLNPADGLVIPEPKSRKNGAGLFTVPARLEIACAVALEAAVEILAEDLALYGVSVARVDPPRTAPLILGVAADPVIAESCAKMGIDTKALKPEGYALVVTPDRILVAGADERGVLYGAQTLRQLIRNRGGKGEIPETKIVDWPDLPFRGYYAATPLPSFDELKPLIRNTYTYFKGNTLVYEVNWQDFQWKSHPEVWEGNKTARPLDELKALAQYARQYKLDFIPLVWTYGRVSKLFKSHPEIAENPNYVKQDRDFTSYCPSKPETYALIFDIMQEIVDTTQCTTMHIGHDEIKDMRKCPLCKKSLSGDLFANDVNKIAGWLAARNVKTMIWGDMLLDYSRWSEQGVSSANSGNPVYGGLPTYTALEKLDKNVIIADWHYRSATGEYPTFKYFVDAGFKTIAATWYGSSNNYDAAREIAKAGGSGILTTDWGFLLVKAPSAATMLGTTYGWNLSSPPPDRLPYSPERVWVASLWRKNRPSRFVGASFKPIDLGAAANKTLGGDAGAWFGLGPASDMSSLPSGRVRLFGVDYLIGKSGVLAGVESKEKNVPGESKGIGVDVKAKSLIFLHTLTLDQPSTELKEYGQYRVTFAGGKTADIPVNGATISLWLTETTRPRGWGWPLTGCWDAVLAWQGCTKFGNPIALQAYEWINPTPDDLIVSVALLARQNEPGLKIALVALTVVQ